MFKAYMELRNLLPSYFAIEVFPKEETSVRHMELFHISPFEIGGSVYHTLST